MTTSRVGYCDICGDSQAEHDRPAPGGLKPDHAFTGVAAKPEHCGRPMLDVVDSNSSSPFYKTPIWWCPDCHVKLPQRKDEIKP